jgi:hypothetical protein
VGSWAPRGHLPAPEGPCGPSHPFPWLRLVRPPSGFGGSFCMGSGESVPGAVYP